MCLIYRIPALVLISLNSLMHESAGELFCHDAHLGLLGFRHPQLHTDNFLLLFCPLPVLCFWLCSRLMAIISAVELCGLYWLILCVL